MSHTEHTKAENEAMLGWDPDDPHGINPHHGEHHHFIADWRMQVSVLMILLFFTFLTVAFFRVEVWAEYAFGIHLPGWVNIVGAMTIATIKGVLVAAYFMQLKYDKVLNTFVLLYCLMCVGLFLGFSMIDLGSRHLVNPVASGEISYGGTGVGLNSAPADEEFSVRVSPKVNTSGVGLVFAARQKGIEKYIEDGKTEKDFWKKFYKYHSAHRDPMDENDYFTQLGYGVEAVVSDANRSRGRTGLTPDIFSDVAPDGDGASDSYGDGH
jgi:caa(3)-type oxidase subunit IV